MHCPFCPPSLCGLPHTVWSYSFIRHVWEKHARDGTLPHLPAETWFDSMITRAEERFHGIPDEATDEFRGEHEIPNSDTFMDMQAEQETDSEDHSNDEGSEENEVSAIVIGQTRKRSTTMASTSSGRRGKKSSKRGS
jgi:hypothetical protein